MTDVLTSHSRIAINQALLRDGAWHGIRHGVRLSMTLENNLLGRMIVCNFTIRRKQQITGETLYEIGNALQAEFRKQGRI